MKLVLATHNAGKVVELRQILADAGVEAELLGMDAFPDVADVGRDRGHVRRERPAQGARGGAGHAAARRSPTTPAWP
ncbi:hypothetical protein JCM9957A_17310 [Kineosporia succinea]